MSRYPKVFSRDRDEDILTNTCNFLVLLHSSTYNDDKECMMQSSGDVPDLTQSISSTGKVTLMDS